MDYEKLALAKEALDSGSYDKETIEYIFPELKEEPEEERIRKAIIDFFSEPGRKEYILNGFTVDDILAWLKYLKDRIQPQPKQEWSEEDEKMYLSIMSVLLSTIGTDKAGFTVTREIAWLKSLKERYTWKPSDEQMEAMQKALVDLCGKDEHNIITGFYYDLKKLKG